MTIVHITSYKFRISQFLWLFDDPLPGNNDTLPGKRAEPDSNVVELTLIWQ